MTTTRPRYIDTAECAKLVRRSLKAAFPGVKFSVRTHSYSMGSHVSVTWTDGPTTEAVEAVAGEFSGSTFDGMTDSRNYHDSMLNGEAVHYAAHDVSCTRHMSDARKAEIKAKIEAATGKPVSSATVYEEGVTVDGRFYSAGTYRTLYRDELVWRIFNEAGSPAKTETEGDGAGRTMIEVAAADFEPVAAWAWEDDNRDYAEEAWQREEYRHEQEEEAEMDTFASRMRDIIDKLSKLEAEMDRIADDCHQMSFLDATPWDGHMRDRVAFMAEADAGSCRVLVKVMKDDLADRLQEWSEDLDRAAFRPDDALRDSE